MYKGLLFPEITAGVSVKNKERHFPKGKLMASCPWLFERKLQLQLPKTCLTKRGPLALGSHQQILETREKKLNFTTFNTFKKVNISRGAPVPEIPPCQYMETTRELKRGILNYHAQRPGQERDIRPGHSARQYLFYWRKCHTVNNGNQSIMEQMKHNGKKRNVVTNSEKHVPADHTAGHLRIPPSPYEIPSIEKTLIVKCPECRKRNSQRPLHSNEWISQKRGNVSNSSTMCSKYSRYRDLRWLSCPDTKDPTHITYPVYWINSATASCSYCNHFGIEEPDQNLNEFIGKAVRKPNSSNRDTDSATTSSGVPEHNQRQTTITDSTSSMSSGNRYIRMKLDQAFVKILNKSDASNTYDLAEKSPRLSIESEQISKYTSLSTYPVTLDKYTAVGDFGGNNI